ncbi:MAG: hypothetical protein E7394_07275 [Ruminococcaceae bacterium]|nr:hypothetical protein [Oscillospiraceae bacterium]
MATTGFWPIKGSLRDVIKYADNPDKTTNPKYLDDDLAAVLKYAENDDKTDMKMFVSGINCLAVRAYEQMMITKRHFGKTGGNVAYHGYQSFKSGEVTPKEAHDIGLETARRMWGKDYEVVVTTHLNTDNIHNHIVINSVSFKTGLKFENHISDHIRLREISDTVCKEYGKSVIEGAKFYNAEKNAYWVHKHGGKTRRDILREDVDDAINNSANYMEFVALMKNKGYIFSRSEMTDHPSVKAPTWERAIRFDKLGDDCKKDKILERIFQTGNRAHFNQFSESYKKTRAKYRHTPLQELEYQLRRVKYMDTLEALFYLFMELLKPITPKPNYTPPLSPELRQEIRKFEQYQKQFRLLHDENINTVPELEAFIGKLSKQISELEEERSKTDNKRRRSKTDEETKAYYAEIRGISAQMKPIRDKLKIAKATLETVPKVQRLLDIERNMESKIKIKDKKKEKTR